MKWATVSAAFKHIEVAQDIPLALCTDDAQHKRVRMYARVQHFLVQNSSITCHSALCVYL